MDYLHSVEITKPSLEDIPQLSQLWEEQYTYHHRLDPTYYVPYSDELHSTVKEYLQKIIREEALQILIAKDGANLVGFITFAVKSESYFDTNMTHFGELKELLVTSNARGKGVGKALVIAAEDHFRALEIPIIAVQCSSFNTIALSTYEKLGYTPRQELLYKMLQKT